MLTALDRKTQFARDGFVIVENLFSPLEMTNAKNEVRRILDEHKAKTGAYPKNGVHVGLTVASAHFRGLNADPRIVDMLEECVSPNLEFWSDKIVFKSAGVDFGSPWHQDWPYWHGANKFSVWLALDDATRENGCLRVIPGSHKTKANHGGEDKEGIGFTNRMRPEDVDESKAIDVPLQAGGAILFHDLLLHSSYKNQSGKDRWAMISTYRDASQDDLCYPFATGAFMVRGKQTGKIIAEGRKEP